MNAKQIATAVAIALQAGCSHQLPTGPIWEESDGVYNYRETQRWSDQSLDNQIVALSFSGGGTRASALAYGVLQGLRRTRIRRQEPEVGTLLEEVDIVSAVSGGSITAGYWAVHGSDGLRKLPEKWLYEDVNRELVMRGMNPTTLARLGSPLYSRGDVVAEYLDEKLFGGTTYSEVGKRAYRAVNGHRPFVILNATNMRTGQRFPFTQEEFNKICADMGRVKIARAVAASAAYPVFGTTVAIPHFGNYCRSGKAHNERNGRTIVRGWIKDGEERAQRQKWQAEFELVRHRVDVSTADLRLGAAREREGRAKAAVERATEIRRLTEKVLKWDEEDVRAAEHTYETKIQLRREVEEKHNEWNQALEKARAELEVSERALQALEVELEKGGESLPTEESSGLFRWLQEVWKQRETRTRAEQMRKKHEIQEKDLAVAEQLTNEARERLQQALHDENQAKSSLRSAKEDAKEEREELRRRSAQIQARTKELREATKARSEAELEVRGASSRLQTAEGEWEAAKRRLEVLNALRETHKQLEANERNVGNAEKRSNTISVEAVQLLDGGIADNLGLGALVEILRVILDGYETAGLGSYLQKIAGQTLVVVVDAGTESDRGRWERWDPPGVVRTVRDAVDTAINTKSVLLERELKRAAKDLKKLEIDVEVVRVTFDDIDKSRMNEDGEVDQNSLARCKAWFQTLPTTWSLGRERASRVVEMGAALLLESKQYRMYAERNRFWIPPQTTVREVCGKIQF